MGRCVARILTLFTLAAITRSAQGCPRPCACPQPGDVHCTFRSLLSIPAGVSRQVERMNLGFNTINRITSSSFAGFRKLELLMMHGNNIHNIPDGTFHELISLQMMKLSFNKLKIISSRTFQGLWNLVRLHLDHNHLEFIHPDAFHGLTSLRLLQLEGNRLQQLHPATFATFSVLGYFPMSTLKHLYLSENGLTTLSKKMFTTLPQLENLFLHENPWTCDCRMKWFKDWSSNAPDILKCKKDKAFPGGQLCPVCFSPKQQNKKELRELDNPKCTIPVISAPHRTVFLDTDSELLTLDDFSQPLGNVSLSLSDEHGNQVALNCHIYEPTKSTRMSWNHVNSFQINTNVSLRLDLECPIERGFYEKLWRLVAYYSDVPAHLKREIMLSKTPHISYRYGQDAEMDAVYFTGVKANIVAEPAWIMQSAVSLQLNRPHSNSKKVRLILSTHLSESVEAEDVRQQKRHWVLIESRNNTKLSQVVVVRNPIQMHCNVHSSGNFLIKWMLPNGSKIEAPYQSTDNRMTVSLTGLLSITAVDHTDSGVYYCIAEVADDISVLSFRLTVEDSSTPASGSESVAEPIAGVTGGSVSVPCLAVGSPDPDINWILPDNTIINTWSNLSRISVVSNGTLIIQNSQLPDSGYYKCVAKTQHGVDSLATKVTLTRHSGHHLRKYFSRPQPAEGVSTQIKAPINNDVEASGNSENEGPETKVFERVNTAYKRTSLNDPVRSGHPTRKVWRRPPLPRRRIISAGADRSKPTETRRRIQVSNGQIDPKHWANILAKVRSSGDAKTTTPPSSVLTSTNSLHQFYTTITNQFDMIPDISTTESLLQEGSYTATTSSWQTSEVSLNIKPLNAKAEINIPYQIAAPDINQDFHLISVVHSTVGPQPTSHSFIDVGIGKWNEASTVKSTIPYATKAFTRARGDPEANTGYHEYSIIKKHGKEVYQGNLDHSPTSATSIVFEEQNMKKDYTLEVFTDIAQTASEDKHDSSQITLLTTPAPKSQSTLLPDRKTSYSRASSNAKRKNNGRRRKPNRNRAKPKLSKSARFQNITPRPTTLAMVSEITKMSVTSNLKIATSTVSTMSMDDTVSFTEKQKMSLNKTDQDTRTDSLLDIKNTYQVPVDNSVNENVSDLNRISFSYGESDMSLNSTVLPVTSSTSLRFIGQMTKEIFSTVSPFIQTSQFTDHETAMSLHLTESERTTGDSSLAIKSDSSYERPQKSTLGPAIVETENLSLPYTSSPYSEEIGSVKTNIYEETHFTTEKTITSTNVQQSGTVSTTKLYSDLSNEMQVTATAKNAEIIAMKDQRYNNFVTSLKSAATVTTPTAPTPTSTLTTTFAPLTISSTTPKRWNPSLIHPHTSFQTISSVGSKSGPDSPNHIPDRHRERILNPQQNIRLSNRNQPTVFHSTNLSKPNKFDIRNIQLSIQTPKPQTKRKFSTTVPKVSGTPPRQSLPARRRQPWITSTNMSTVTVQAESDANLPCMAIGEPRPFVSWTKISTGASITQKTSKIQRFEVHPNGTLTIHKVLPLDQGQYLCSVQNQYGQDKLVLTLIVLAEYPRIFQPRYQEISRNLEDTIDLDCRSEGNPHPRITWVLPNRTILHMDVPSPGANERVFVLANGTLRIKSATFTDHGVYKCIASNPAGAATISVRLTVIALPPVIHQLKNENISITEGSNVYLNCSAKGVPTPTISWSMSNGVQFRSSEFVSGLNLFVFNNGTLYIRGLGTANAGKYQCTASNKLGLSSRAVSLTVKKSIASARARIISSSPQKTDVIYGGKLQLDCVASGDPEPRVIWRTPSKKLVDAHYSYDPRIKVSANGSLFIHSVTEKDEGDYLCAAHNKMGDDYAPLKVSILTKPAKIEQKTQINQKVMYGGDLKVDCVASGLPNPNIQWALPDGTMVNSIMKTDSSSSSPSKRYGVFDNGTLFFNDVGMHMEGDYTCYAENQIGKDEMKIHVKVVADVPVIRNNTFEVIRVIYGDSASLTCSAKGEPNPQILWFSPSNREISSVSNKYLIHNDGTLIIHKVQRFDGGNYTCLARNRAGQARKVTRLEILVSPPAINGLRGYTNSLKVSAMKNQRKMIHCEASGTPVPNVLWVLPENVILQAPYYGSRMTVHQNGTLDIYSVRVTDMAKLTCIARNEGGEARFVVQLDVIDINEKAKLKSSKTNSLSITVGKTMMLNCSLEGTPARQMTWVLPSGSTLMSGSQLKKFFHRSDGILVITNAAGSDAGTYRCLARNAGVLVEMTVVLTPGQKPEINNRYNSPVSVINGENLQLHCLSSSDPVRLTWTLPSGVVLNRPQRAGRYAVQTNGTLSIQQASVYDRGSYTCRAANEYGSSLLTIPVSIIAYPPQISSGPPPTTYARRGVAVQLNCVATGIPKAEVAWETPDRTRLIVSSQPRLFGNKYIHPQGFLIIQNPTSRDGGFYRCTARNVIGVDSKGTYLHVY